MELKQHLESFYYTLTVYFIAMPLVRPWTRRMEMVIFGAIVITVMLGFSAGYTLCHLLHVSRNLSR
jgi:hypothetical protein